MRGHRSWGILRNEETATLGGNLNKLLLVLAVSMVIGLGVSVASAATTCNPVLTPGENLALVAAHCPPSTTFTIKDGTYKLSRAVIASSGDTFKGVYSDRTRPKIDANGASMAFNVGDTKGVTSGASQNAGVPSRRTVGTSTSLT